MENDELLNQVESGVPKEKETKSEETEEPVYRYLVFRIQNQSYALQAEEVQEISANHEVFYVPFVPPYVRGYANRHGLPYTVFDILMLFENTPLEGKHLLILKDSEDNAALLISEVEEILRVPQSHIYRLAAEDDVSRYFNGSLKTDKGTVFILDRQNIMERLERDIERA